MHNKRFKISWNIRSILLTIIFIYILYEFCIQIVYIIVMMHTFCGSELTYIKCLFTKYVPHLTNVSIRILYATFSCHSCSNFAYIMHTKVCQNMVYIFYTFCIHQMYTSCTMFVYKMYTQFLCGNVNLLQLFRLIL